MSCAGLVPVVTLAEQFGLMRIHRCGARLCPRRRVEHHRDCLAFHSQIPVSLISPPFAVTLSPLDRPARERCA
jgi:hypothetical protein